MPTEDRGYGYRLSRSLARTARKKPRDLIQPRWRVYLLRKNAERFPFTVTVRDADQAIERAVEEFEIPERDRWRISVQREA